MSKPIDREEDLFLQALNISAAERAAFLDKGCGSDAQLRARLDELLLAHERSVGPLDKRPLCGEPQETAEHFASTPGTVIAGRYKLLEEIGEGGMGTVWVAQQTEPVVRKVALKLVKPGMDSRQVIARFNAERQALALMDHPNIAKVFDGGLTEQGRPYFVMEYVKGVPFTEYCDHAKLPLRERLALFVQACQAVQHAHQKGIIHRDLKPSNILACLYDGKPVLKVIDFGLAKAMYQPLTDQTLHTAHGMMLGTPLYMSPEQAEFNNLDVDTRSDIYSLGVILYELLTGSTPLEKQQLKAAAYNEILRLIKEVEPPKPSTRLSGSATLPGIAAQRNLEPHQLRRSVRGELDWIVMKALDKERSRRYETANGLARDIERYLHQEPVEACPPSASYRLRKFARKHRVLLATMASFGIILLGSTVIGWSLANWALRERLSANDAKQIAENEAERAKAANENALVARKQAEDQTEVAKQNLLRTEMVLAWDAYQNGNIVEAQRLIENHRNWPQQGIEWKILNCELESFGKPWAQLGYNMALKVEVSSDSKVLAVSGESSLSILDDQGRQIVPRIESWKARGDSTTPTAISSDGRLVAFKPGTDDPFKIRNLMTGLEEQLTQEYASFTTFAFSPTNSSIVAVANPGEVRLFDWTQQKDVHRWNRNLSRAENSRWHNRELAQSKQNELRFSQDGSLLAVYGSSSNLEVWNCNSGALVQTWPNDFFLQGVDLSPNGELLAACHLLAPYDVWVGEVSTGKTVATLHGHTRSVLAVRFLDNHTLVSSGRDHSIRIWDIRNQRELKSLYSHSHYIESIARSDDSQEIFTCDRHGEIRKWNLAKASANRQFAARYQDQICDVLTTGDGSKLVAAQLRRKEIQVWDLMSGLHIEELAFDDPVERIAISKQDILAVGGKSSVVIYDLASKKKIELRTGLSRSGRVGFSKDGRYLAAREEGLIVWDLQDVDWTSGRQKVPSVVRPEILQSVSDLQWSPHGAQLAVVGIKGLFLWNVGETQAIPLSSTPLSKVAWSNNGSALACATQDGKIRVFDIRSGLERPLTNVQAAYSWRIAFSPDDSAIITTSGDHSVYIWDARDGMLRARLPGHVDGAMSLLITPDKKRLITGGLFDGRIRVWNIE